MNGTNPFAFMSIDATGEVVFNKQVAVLFNVLSVGWRVASRARYNRLGIVFEDDVQFLYVGEDFA